MKDKEFFPIYSHSFAEAKQLGELNDWKASHRENIACKNAIEAAIRRDFDGMHLKEDCAESVVHQFGYHRMAYVLANSLQCKAYDGRFSRSNHDWAKQIYIPPDKDSYSNRNLDFAVDSTLPCWTALSASTAEHIRHLGCLTMPNACPLRKSRILKERCLSFCPKY